MTTALGRADSIGSAGGCYNSTVRTATAFTISLVALAGCWLDRAGLGAGSVATGGGDATGGGGVTVVAVVSTTSTGGSDPGASVGGGAPGGGGASTGGAEPLDPCSEDGVVVCYRFEGTTDDGGPGAHHATPTNVSYAPGRVGQALHHDVGSRVVVPAAPIALGTLTFEAWVRPTSLPTSGRQGVLDHDGRIGVWILDGGVIQCRAGGLVSGSVLVEDEWTHVACTFEADEIAIYLDGEVDAVGANSGLDDSPTLAHLGSNAPSGDELIGYLDEVRVFSYRRSAAEICEAAGLTRCQR